MTVDSGKKLLVRTGKKNGENISRPHATIRIRRKNDTLLFDTGTAESLVLKWGAGCRDSCGLRNSMEGRKRIQINSCQDDESTAREVMKTPPASTKGVPFLSPVA